MRLKTVLLTLMVLALSIAPAMASSNESQLNMEYVWDQLAKFLNIALVFALLYFLLGKKIREFFKNRAVQIDENLNAARIAREEAEAKLAEVEREIADLENRVAEITRDAVKEGEREKEKIVNQANAEAGKILSAAEAEIANRIKAGRRELKEYAAKLAVQRAGEIIRDEITDDEDNRIIDGTFDNMRGVQ